MDKITQAFRETRRDFPEVDNESFNRGWLQGITSRDDQLAKVTKELEEAKKRATYLEERFATRLYDPKSPIPYGGK